MSLVPNLYNATLPASFQQKAEADPFGTVTLWTYFNNCIDHFAKWTTVGEDEIDQTANEDVVVAAFKLYASSAHKKEIPELDRELFIKLLNRCVICTPDIVEGADTWMEEETGISAFKTPSLLGILVAVAIKHVNHEVLVKFSMFKLPATHIFRSCSSAVISYLEKSALSPSGWDALQNAGWIEESPRQTKSTDKSAKANSKYEPHDSAKQGVGAVLDSCARDLPCSNLRSYFSRIPRTLYSGISPHPKWPGSPLLIKYAASRTDADGVEVLRLLVEIGGMDINDKTTWWKAGDHDPRAWEPKCHDGSDCTETPLHIAVDKGNVDIVQYLLTHGARRLPDLLGKDQRERADLRGRVEVIETFEKNGWLKHGREGRMADGPEPEVHGQQWLGRARSVLRR
ncbi:Fc.00g093700.m01.CDS01 [Cosmosporella sp. VM-42]